MKIVWGILLVLGLVGLIATANAGCAAEGCQQLAVSVLRDTAACVGKGVAEGAQGVLSETADYLFSGSSQEQLESDLKAVGARVGVNALGCALETWITTLAKGRANIRPGASPSASTRARERASLARSHGVGAPGSRLGAAPEGAP